MKIVASDLRMDASTSYRDVCGQVGLNSANRRTAGNDDQDFQWKLAMSAGNGIEKDVERKSTKSRSSGGTGGDPAENSSYQQKIAVTEVERFENLPSLARGNIDDPLLSGNSP